MPQPPPSQPLPFDPIAEAQRQWNEHWGEDATAPMGAVTSIMRVQQILLARLNELLEPWELTFPRYEALMLLLYSRKGSLPLGKMGERLQVHRASVTNVVDRLAQQGFVERIPQETDRRSVLARITPEGRKVARAATKRLNEERFGTAPWSDRRCDDVFRTLLSLRQAAGDFSRGGARVG
jgi:DNA-binding MarR family transcriptional regulator